MHACVRAHTHSASVLFAVTHVQAKSSLKQVANHALEFAPIFNEFQIKTALLSMQGTGTGRFGCCIKPAGHVCQL